MSTITEGGNWVMPAEGLLRREGFPVRVHGSKYFVSIPYYLEWGYQYVSYAETVRWLQPAFDALRCKEFRQKGALIEKFAAAHKSDFDSLEVEFRRMKMFTIADDQGSHKYVGFMKGGLFRGVWPLAELIAEVGHNLQTRPHAATAQETAYWLPHLGVVKNVITLRDEWRMSTRAWRHKDLGPDLRLPEVPAAPAL
jgi:hypothetical protein